MLLALLEWARSGAGHSKANAIAILPLGAAALAATATGTAPFGLTSLFLVFLKIGSVLFGSGYVLGGFWGAVVATVGIFLPAFVIVALSGPLVPRIRSSPVADAFLDGVNAGSIAPMALVTAQLARAAIVDAWTTAIAAVSTVLLLRSRASPAWLVPAGGVLGLVLTRERAPVIPAGGHRRLFLDWGQVVDPTWRVSTRSATSSRSAPFCSARGST